MGDGDSEQTAISAGSLFDLERRAVRWWHPLAVLAVLGLLYVIAARLGLGHRLTELGRWMDTFGAMAPVGFVGVYVLLTVLGCPGSPLTAAGGAVFGAWGGIAVSLLGSTVAATISFFIARRLAPASVRRRLAASRSFRHLDLLVTRRGALAVLAVRLINLLPFAVVNYGFGLTNIRAGTYILWSLLGKIPGTVVLVVGMDLVVEALLRQRVSWPQFALVLAMALTLGLVINRARHWLEDDAAEPSE